MRFKEEFLKELIKRLKENIDIIESSFILSDIELVKTKLYSIDPCLYRLNILIEEDPYLFLNKLTYIVINKQQAKAVCDNLACSLLLEIVNMILDEFNVERIDRID